MREPLAGPGSSKDLHGLDVTREPLVERDAKHPELLLAPAEAQAEHESPARQLVDDRGVLGQPHGIVQRRQDHAGSQLMRVVAWASAARNTSNDGR